MKDHASKLKGFVWVAVAVVLGVFFAVGLSPLAHIIPWSWEKRLGEVIRLDLPEKDCRPDPAAEALLQRLVQRLYPISSDDREFTIEVHVAPSLVVNAYAGLGGVITLNSGLLNKAESPEEVAGVLAHEIEHVRYRHVMEGVVVHFFTSEGIQLILGNGSAAAGFARYILNMDFSRDQERQADEAGLRRLQAAQVDNRGFKCFFEKMEKYQSGSSFLSDHPSNRERIELTERFKNQTVRPILTQEEWKILRNFCGKK